MIIQKILWIENILTITGKKLPQALLKLNSLQKNLVTDADKAAFFFAMGLFCEYAGKFDEMAALYNQANDLGHKFYLPYLKAGKYALDTRDYGTAEKNYRAAVSCFSAMALSDKEKQDLIADFRIIDGFDEEGYAIFNEKTFNTWKEVFSKEIKAIK